VVALLGFAYDRTIGAAQLDASLGPLYPQIREIFPKGPEALRALTAASSWGSLVLTPITYLFNLHVAVFLTWAGLRLAGGMRTSYGHILRMFAYAGWIQIFGILGVTGYILLSIAGFALSIGFGSYYWLAIVRASQGIETRRAIYASIYGGLIGVGAGCIFGVPLLAGVVYLLVTMPPPP